MQRSILCECSLRADKIGHRKKKHVNHDVTGIKPSAGAMKKDIQSDVFFQLYLPSASYIASQLYSASPSDIVLRTVIGKYNITEAEGFNITFALQKYHSNRVGI